MHYLASSSSWIGKFGGDCTKIAIIGGTGLYDTSFLRDPEERIIDTEYGQTKVYVSKIDDREIIFLPRHGIQHGVLAYQVNYHANMKALEQLGVKRAIAMNAVGSVSYTHLTLPTKRIV